MTDYVNRTRDFYALLVRDFESALDKYVTNNTVWENPLPDSIPFGGTYSGPDGIREYMVALASTIEMSPLHFDEMMSQGSTVVAIGCEEDTLVKPTGKRYTMPCVHVVQFDNKHKVEKVREYNDITQMLSAFEPD